MLKRIWGSGTGRVRCRAVVEGLYSSFSLQKSLQQIWKSVDVFSQRETAPQALPMCFTIPYSSQEPWEVMGIGCPRGTIDAIYGGMLRAIQFADDRLTANPGRLAVEPLQQFRKKAVVEASTADTPCPTAPYPLQHSTTLYSSSQSTALRQFYSLQPLHHPSALHVMPNTNTLYSKPARTHALSLASLHAPEHQSSSATSSNAACMAG